LGPNVANQDTSNIDEFFSDDSQWEKLGYGLNDEEPDIATPTEKQFPPPILERLEPEYLEKCKSWLANRLQELRDSHDEKMTELAVYIEAYKAPISRTVAKTPFVGASIDIVPVIAMAVDPVVARLDIGIMKQNPVFAVTPLRKSLVDYRDCIEDWLQFNQEHRWKLRQVAAPRFHEFCNLGTMVFKTVYDRVEAPIKTWERDQVTNKFKQVQKKLVKFTGARVFGVPLDRFYFPPGYSTLDDCPITAERLDLTYEQLRVAEASGKITDVAKLGKVSERTTKSDIEQQQDANAGHEEPLSYKNQYELFEVWFDYDIDGDGYPESLVAIFEPESRTFLQLTYNWYFHQKKPYTVIPYTLQDGTLYGMGLAEMILPFQNAISRWQQMAQNNAYLANIRMYVAKKNSGIEEVPRLYAGRVFFTDDPSKDFKPFAAADIYPSTLTERQNLFGMVEKRTGVSDYLTGRESPIIGSRATATSTIALIQEGTKRVEQTLENIRQGFADIAEKSFCIWFQYGTEELEDLVFGTDETAGKIKDFFSMMSAENVINGAIGVTLKAADAGDNKQARQQMQLAIINLMMSFLEKQLQAAESALEAVKQGIPEFAPMVADTLTAAKKMFTDLLQTYDIRNPEQYLPDLNKYLGLPDNGSPAYPGSVNGQGGSPNQAGGPPGIDQFAGMAGLSGAGQGPIPGRPDGAPSSGRPPFLGPLTG
jgi:hypothetical protein